MHSPNPHFPRLLLLAASLAVLTWTSMAYAQSNNRQVGTQFTVTADPLVQRPHVKPCVVSLFTNYRFAFFSDSVQNFQFAPPASCPGPWQKVVLEVNFSENAGVQFDRTASVYIANSNLYFGTTPEPLSTVTNTWHIERDVTDYSALLNTLQQGTIVLQNCPLQHGIERSFYRQCGFGVLSRPRPGSSSANTRRRTSAGTTNL
jgi:hypothetical protein